MVCMLFGAGQAVYSGFIGEQLPDVAGNKVFEGSASESKSCKLYNQSNEVKDTNAQQNWKRSL